MLQCADHALDEGRLAWWRGVPPICGGPQWYDLLGRFPGAVTGVSWTPSPFGSMGVTGAGGTGTTQGVIVADPLGRLAGMATLTVAVWARATSSGGSGAGRIITQNDTLGYAIAINGSSGCQFIVGGTTLGVAALGNLSDSRWHRYALTYDGAAIRGYFDGQLVGSIAKTGAVPASTAGVVIGNRQASSGGGRAWGGQIADPGLWSPALPAELIAFDYAASGRGYRRRPRSRVWLESPAASPLVAAPGSFAAAGASATGAGRMAGAAGASAAAGAAATFTVRAAGAPGTCALAGGPAASAAALVTQPAAVSAAGADAALVTTQPAGPPAPGGVWARDGTTWSRAWARDGTTWPRLARYGDVNVQTLVACASDARDYVFDFSAATEIGAGATIVSATIEGGEGLSIGTPSPLAAAADGVRAGRGVSVRIGGGAAGTAYALACVAVLTTGATLVVPAALSVVSDTGS